MYLRILLYLLLGALPAIAHAQHQEIAETPMPYKGKEQVERDTTSILSAFKHGKTNGHFRYFFMASNNTGGLTDYYANAAGGGIRFETASFYGFRFAVGGSYVFNIASSDLAVPDSTTGSFNRYEIGLFDVQQPAFTDGIDRLEELYLKYQLKSSEITLGRQFINTPFINLQDGRMRPGAVEGLVIRWKDWGMADIESGFLYAMSPRSTSRWYAVENTFGIYPSGVNPDGSKSDYQGHINTPGIMYVGVSSKWKGKYKVQVWDVVVPNVMNSFLLEVGIVQPIDPGRNLIGGLQFIRQDGIGNGGSNDISQSYFPENGKAVALGIKAGYQQRHFETSVQYTRITAAGRYLMPREWGRDPLFTFLPRERNEGLGDVHAFVVKASIKELAQGLTLGIGAGYYELPDVRNTTLNKYGMPSYAQVNLDLRYFFKGLFEGLDFQYLLAAKFKTGESYANDKYVFNKVDMQVHNLVLNYHF